MKTTILATISITAMLAFMASPAAGRGGAGGGVGGPAGGGGAAGPGGRSAGGGNAGVGGPSAGGGFGGAGSTVGASPANPPAGETLPNITPGNNHEVAELITNNLGVITTNLVSTNFAGIGSNQISAGSINNNNTLAPTGPTNGGAVALPEQGPTPLPQF